MFRNIVYILLNVNHLQCSDMSKMNFYATSYCLGHLRDENIYTLETIILKLDH